MNLSFKVLVYINGIHFDPIGVSYSSSEGQHAVFTVTVPSVPHWSILPERSHCAVFFADPISNSWRLLCEGEYIGDNRTRSATGDRARALAFRTTHGIWNTTTYSKVVGLTSGDIGQVSAPDQLQSSIASGIQVQTTPNSAGDLARTNLYAFLSAYSTPGTRISTFLPNFLAAVMQQAPVDAFYNVARRLQDKMFSLADDEIGGVIDSTMFLTMMREGFNQKVTSNMTLEEIVRGIEDITMYQHVTVPAPPLYANTGASAGFTIGELFFLPHLYSSIPPACNVIFKDQITNISSDRNFLAEPTRVVTQLQAHIVGMGDLPLFVMSNDAERVVTVSDSNASVVNQTSQQASPGTLVMHDFLTQEEYHRGVVAQMVSFPFQNLGTRLKDMATVTNDPTQDQAQTNKILTYVSHTARHFYEVARGENRRAVVTASFLPYAMPGFPCLIEDNDGSFWGIIRSVNHTLFATAQPSTTLEISHVREAYIREGHVRNTYNPLWLNKAFLPSNINDTYAKLLGNNANDAITAGLSSGAHAAMVPASVITAVGLTQTSIPLNAKDQINLDELAAFVIPIQRYTEDGRYVTTDTAGTVAEKIRRTNDVQLACLKFQFRAGTTLSQFAKFHKLPGIPAGSDTAVNSANPVDYVYATAQIPVDLAGGKPNVLYGTPFRMIFQGAASLKAGSPYGVYTLDTTNNPDGITYIRQQAALTIRDAIAAAITND